MHKLVQSQSGITSQIDWEFMTTYFLTEDLKIYTVRKEQLITNKLRNRNMRRKNGNRTDRNNFNILHWNLGSSHWVRKKIEIEAVLIQHKPDIMIVTEANLLIATPPEESSITGYNSLLPKQAQGHNISRIVILVADHFEARIIPKWMDTSVAAIWLKIGPKGKKQVVLGAVYREHQYILQDHPDDSLSDNSQLERWRKFVRTWVAATAGNEVIVMGDLNLDFVKWGLPEPRKSKMVELVKNEIETLGYHQMVREITRSWPGQPDSIIDHIWMNFPGKLIYMRNIQRAYSDHNIILASIRRKQKNVDTHDFTKRDMKNFDPEKYKKEVEKIDWKELLETSNIDLINNIFVTKILKYSG